MTIHPDPSTLLRVAPSVSRGELRRGMTLIARSFGRIVRPFVSILVLLTGFQIALIAVAASFAERGDFERLSQLVPSFLQQALSPAVASFGSMTTIGYFDVLIVMLVVQYAIYVATEPAGEVESGLVDLVLARPLSRHMIVTRSLVLMMMVTLTLTLAMGFGTLIGLWALAPPGVRWPDARTILLMMAHLTMVAWCFGAAGLASAGWARRRGSAVAVVAIAAMALYLLDFLGLWWTPVETLARVSPFSYFHGGPILAGTTNSVRDLSVLSAMAIAGVATAYWRFERRDL